MPLGAQALSCSHVVGVGARGCPEWLQDSGHAGRLEGCASSDGAQLGSGLGAQTESQAFREAGEGWAWGLRPGARFPLPSFLPSFQGSAVRPPTHTRDQAQSPVFAGRRGTAAA